jgi:ribosomal protein S18 acetylase RimI-like enzyme
VRHPVGADHQRVLAALDRWRTGPVAAGGAQPHRVFFEHFADTSYVVDNADGALLAFLIGFLSQSQPETAYIHLVSVDPSLRRLGVACALYARFREAVAQRGARRVQCITSPGNLGSVAFHTAIGFRIEPSDIVVDGVAVQPDYGGPGIDRILFTQHLD